MTALKKNWWKICLAVIVGLALDGLLHAISPVGGIELVPNAFSQAIGLIPAINVVLAIYFAVIAVIFVLMQEGLAGPKWVKGLRYGLAIAGLWFVGFFELDVPWSHALAWAVEDTISIILMSILLSIMVTPDNAVDAKKSSGWSICLIASVVLVGRHLVYLFLQPQLDYWLNPMVTFGWALIFGLVVGTMYWLVAAGLKGESPLSRGFWFAGVVFGLNWWLYNMFVPLLFQAPSALTVEMATMRVMIDIIFVLLGVFAFERGLALKSGVNSQNIRNFV